MNNYIFCKKYQLCNFIDIVLRHGCSLVNLLHIFRATFPKKTSGRLLLVIQKLILEYISCLEGSPWIYLWLCAISVRNAPYHWLISPVRFPLLSSPWKIPGKFPQIFQLSPVTFEISVSVSFLSKLYIFGCWITGECDYSRVKLGQDLIFASKARHWKNSDKFSNIFEKNLSKQHVKSS